MPNKKAYHPDGSYTIQFREHNHSYIDNHGTRYVSGTTVIKPFFPKFDPVAVSVKCSKGSNPKYAGREPEEIRSEWIAEGQRGSREGDNLHEYAEGLISGWPVHKLPKPISERCEQLFIHARKITAWLNKKYQFIEAEKIVFSPELKIAGMIDLLMWDQIRQEILILDWKQNKEITDQNFHQNAHSPIEHLEDTHVNKYALQLSLYQCLLQRENYYPKAKGFRRALIHITPETVMPIQLEFYEYEIKEMLKCQTKLKN